MPAPRPPQPETPAPDAFEIHRAEVAEGLRLAYLREGEGGYPLLLVHGYPETKRVWWRNIRPLAEAGYEVVSVQRIGNSLTTSGYLMGFGVGDLTPDAVASLLQPIDADSVRADGHGQEWLYLGSALVLRRPNATRAPPLSSAVTLRRRPS